LGSYPSELTNSQWAVIERMIPEAAPSGPLRRAPKREIVEAGRDAFDAHESDLIDQSRRIGRKTERSFAAWGRYRLKQFQ
jgi:transposase